MRRSPVRIGGEEARVARVFHCRSVDDHERSSLVCVQSLTADLIGMKHRHARIAPRRLPRLRQSFSHGLLHELPRHIRHTVQGEAAFAKIPYRNRPLENVSVLDMLRIEHLAQEVLVVPHYTG